MSKNLQEADKSSKINIYFIKSIKIYSKLSKFILKKCFYCTVEPLYNDLLWGQEKADVIEGVRYKQGSQFSSTYILRRQMFQI